MCSICREKDEFNELLHRFDFLDSVDWLGIRANMRKLHSKKTSGKTLDGANVFLEIVARDSHMQRDLLAEVKKVKHDFTPNENDSTICAICMCSEMCNTDQNSADEILQGTAQRFRSAEAR